LSNSTVGMNDKLDSSRRLFYILSVQDPITYAILDSMTEGVLVFDFGGHLIFSNPSAASMLNLPERVPEKSSYVDLFVGDPENDAFHDIILGGVRSREGQVCREVPFLRSDGVRMDLAVTTSFLRGGAGTDDTGGVVMVFRDISDSKALERARHRVIDHLSHELKTPIAIIRATLKQMDRKGSEVHLERIERNMNRLQEIQREVDDIVRRTRHNGPKPPGPWMLQMLDLLELVAKSDRVCEDPVRLLEEEIRGIFDVPSAQPMPLPVAQAITEILDKVRGAAAHRQVAIESLIEGNPLVWIDPGAFEKVVMALLKNSIEATPDGGSVILSLHETGDEVIMEVKDTGIGITPESRTQIFGGFFHARDTNLYATGKPFDFGAGGKGLDLFHLKILADIYNFLIECESVRCRFIPKETDLCPGVVLLCPHVTGQAECALSGSTTFRVTFKRYAPEGSTSAV
jgi:signal transduction histidine kinase